MAEFCHPEFGCDCSEDITLTREQSLGVLEMLESFLGTAHERAATPQMPCGDAGCGYPLCEFMRQLQKVRETA